MKREELRTPCFVVQEGKIRENLEILKKIEDETGCHILLAQKAFSMYSLYPLIGEYLAGATASGLYEARLGYEEMGKENHIFSPAYREEEMDEILKYLITKPVPLHFSDMDVLVQADGTPFFENS